MKYEIDKELLVELNGDRQNIRIRAAQKGLPVLLFIHGGPGVCNRHSVMGDLSGLADTFTMVCWDQRLSGKSYRKLNRGERICVDDYVNDARALTEYLRAEFGGDIYVAGHSWGSIIGLLLITRYPDGIKAYIGQGQFVNGTLNEKLSYEFCLAEAKKAGDKKALKKLAGGAPVAGQYPTQKAMMTQRDYLTRFGGADYNHRCGMIKSLLIPLLKSPEYSLADISKYAKGGMYLSRVLWPEVVSYEFDKTITEVSVPVIITQGRYDYNTPSELAKQWFDNLKAPYKRWIWFENSAHGPMREEPDLWVETVKKEVERLNGQN